MHGIQALGLIDCCPAACPYWRAWCGTKRITTNEDGHILLSHFSDTDSSSGGSAPSSDNQSTGSGRSQQSHSGSTSSGSSGSSDDKDGSSHVASSVCARLPALHRPHSAGHHVGARPLHSHEAACVCVSVGTHIGQGRSLPGLEHREHGGATTTVDSSRRSRTLPAHWAQRQ